MFDFANSFQINKGYFPIYNSKKTAAKNTKNNKQNKSYLYIASGTGIGAFIAGGISILKCKKNFRNKYVCYLKNALSKFLTTTSGDPYCQKIADGKVYNKHYNFITYYKTIKNNIKNLTDYCKKHKECLEEQQGLIDLKEKLINMNTIFIDIKKNFNNEYINRSTKYCLKNTFIGGIIGTIVGFCSNIFMRSQNENK